MSSSKVLEGRILKDELANSVALLSDLAELKVQLMAEISALYEMLSLLAPVASDGDGEDVARDGDRVSEFVSKYRDQLRDGFRSAGESPLRAVNAFVSWVPDGEVLLEGKR